jgi:hypothetical protein
MDGNHGANLINASSNNNTSNNSNDVDMINKRSKDVDSQNQNSYRSEDSSKIHTPLFLDL